MSQARKKGSGLVVALFIMALAFVGVGAYLMMPGAFNVFNALNNVERYDVVIKAYFKMWYYIDSAYVVGKAKSSENKVSIDFSHSYPLTYSLYPKVKVVVRILEGNDVSNPPTPPEPPPTVTIYPLTVKEENVFTVFEDSWDIYIVIKGLEKGTYRVLIESYRLNDNGQFEFVNSYEITVDVP